MSIGALPATAWMTRGACCGMADLFDAAADGRSGPGDTDAQAAAIEVCFGCPVREDCLEFALDTDGALPFGIYGGLKPGERANCRRGGPPADCGHRWPNRARPCPECRHQERLRRDAQILAQAAEGRNVHQIHQATGVAHRTIGDVLARYASSG